MPHWGEWAVLADSLASFWSNKASQPPGFPAVVSGWLEVNRRKVALGVDPWRGLLSGLPGLDSSQARSANDAVWKLRNDRAHRTATHEGGQRDVDLDQRLQPVVRRMIHTLFPPGSLTLVRRLEGLDQMIRMQGPHLNLEFRPEPVPDGWLGALSETGVVAITGENVTPVYPLLIPGNAEPEGGAVPGGGLLEDLSMVDGVTDRRVVLLGVRSHGVSERHIGPLLAALARKRVDPGQDAEGTTRWTLAGWARTTARAAVALLRGRKYFPEFYVARRGVDDRVAECVETPGRGLLLLGDAGAGKSSLLARLVERLAAEPAEDPPRKGGRGKHRKGRGGDGIVDYLTRKGAGDVVIFLAGQEISGGLAEAHATTLLRDAVLLRAGVAVDAFVSVGALIQRLGETAARDNQLDRRVWLIFDAINEAPRFTDLVAAIDELLPLLGHHTWLRIVVSMRTGAYEALGERHRTGLHHGPAGFRNLRFLHTFEADGSEVPYLEVRPFHEDVEGRRPTRHASLHGPTGHRQRATTTFPCDCGR